MDNNDFDIDWGDDDDLFGGDIDFNDDFDMDPYKNKSFLSAAASGFLQSVTDSTIGSSDAAINTARRFLPSSFSNGLDRLRYLKDKGSELVREFQESNYESVKSLQSIAKNIAGRINSEDSFIKTRLNNFSTKDFSSWEKYSSDANKDDVGKIEDVSDDEISAHISSIMDKQTSAFASISAGLNEMSANVGGRTISAVMAGNKELIGIQSGIKDLLDYQRRIQAKLDSTKIELLARTYLLNAKFYKFMEKGIHAEINELKKVVINTGLSDYEKTTNFQATKNKIRDVTLNRTGGMLGRIIENFGKEGRSEKYNAFESATSQILSMLEMGEGLSPSWGMAGNMAGGMLGQWFMSELPRLINQGPFDKLKQRMFRDNPEYQEKFDKFTGGVRNIGNKFSYNMNSLPGMLQYYTQYWEELDENKYYDYEDYLAQMEEAGKKPMPKAAFVVLNPLTNQGKSFANKIFGGLSKVNGDSYSIKQRDSRELAKAGIWKEINNVTLVDVIPGLLRMQYESLEKIRTGNDSFVAPTYSFNRGQFVSNSNAHKVVEADVFNHSNFYVAARNANNLASEIDSEGMLTPEERNELSLHLVQNASKKYGFNPYYYINGIGSENQELNERIGSIIRKRFDMTDEQIKEYEESGLFDKAKMAAFGFNGDAGERLSNMGSLAQSLQDTVPNIAESVSNARSSGNDQVLRELGIIINENGREKIDMNKFWERMQRYILNPDDTELRGDIDTSGSLDGGDTLNDFRGAGRRDSSNINKKSRKISDQANRMQDTAVKTTEVLNETMGKLTEQINSFGKMLNKIDISNLSNIKIDTGTIPDELKTIREVIEKMQAYDSRQESLLEQIAGCVCRQAGGWNKLSDKEKEDAQREESAGKKSIMDRIKEISPRNLFNKGVEALVNNQPLVLGGLLGGLGVLAMHDPKAAMLISGGMVAAKIYSKLGEIARGREPEDDEDILDEDGERILKASKLRNGDYFDTVSQKVIKEWKDIKGALYDLVSKTYITIATLTGKLFGADGRAIIISGLSKVKDALVKIWNKVDIFGRFGSALTKGKEMFYQQDIYVKGEKEPRLTRGGFMNGKYYCYDTNTREPFPIRGWNEIDGPVYELGPDSSLNQIITEEDLANGLVTSTGVTIDNLAKFTKWTGLKVLEGLGKAKDYSLEKAGLIQKKVKETFANDYSGIEGRLDKIYYLLCDKFGYSPDDFGYGDTVNVNPNPTPPPSGTPIDDIVDNVKTDSQPNESTPNKIKLDSDYPDKIRLNSFEDQEIQAEKQKRDDFYDNVEGIRKNMDEQAGKGEGEDKKENKGLLGTIASWLVGKSGFLQKLITNPMGFIMGGLFNTMLKAPIKLVNLGTMLFSKVLGTASPIYKVLSWGFGGMMWGLRKLLFSNVESFGDWVGGRRERARRRRRRRGNRRLGAGRVGRILSAGLMAYTGYEAYQGIKGLTNNDSGNRNILADGKYDSFYGDPEAQFNPDDDSPDNTSNEPRPQSEPEYESNLGVGMSTSEVAANAALGGAQAIGTARALGLRGAASRGAGLTERAVGGLLGRTAGKVAGRAVPLVGQAMALMDAYQGFTNKDEVGEIFNTKVINGRQRLSNGISNVLDLGGLFSGTMNWAADKTGFEFLRQEGGMTRTIDKVLKATTAGPLKYINPLSLLTAWETDVANPQNKVRLAMYGLEKGDSTFGRAIGALEYQLDKYVKFNQNAAWIDEKAPVAEILNSFSTDGPPEETAKWFNLRFKPIYLTFQSAIRMVGFNSLQEFDRSKSPSVLKVIERVRTSIIGIHPYPLDIVALVDKDNPIMARIPTDAAITNAIAIVNARFKELGINEDGSTDLQDTIKSKEEYAQGVKTKDNSGLYERFRTWTRSIDERAMGRMFTEDVKVIDIDISDLHKDQNTKVDVLTLLRLAVYGNVDTMPTRVDAVLKLERYCESLTSFSGGDIRFLGKNEDIYNLFKNTFRCNDNWTKEWMTWFNQRFLPVFKVWFSEVYKLRRGKPQQVWQTLSATNRHTVGFALTQAIVSVEKDKKSVWDVSESPFMGTDSGTDAKIVNPFLNNLEMKATEAKLNTPDLELEKSKPKDMGSSSTKKMSEASERSMLNEFYGRKTIDSNTINYSPNVSLYRTTGDGNNYTETVNRALGMGNNAPGGAEVAQIERDAGNYSGSAGDFQPTSLQTEKGFKISEREAIKTILNEFVKAGITDNRVLAFALANAKAETGFQGSAENLNYTPQSILNTWPTRFTPQQAHQFGRVDSGPDKHPANQKMIAKIAYGNRYGNQGGDDGWLYRGRGFTQLTFKNNYKRVGEAIGERIENDPEKVTKDPVLAAKTAAGFFKVTPAIEQNLAVGNVEGAALKVGTERGGVNRKIAAYGSFLKRLTQGDLKDILNSSETEAKDNADTTQTASDDSNPNVNPNMPAEAAQVNQQPVSSDTSLPNQVQNDPTQVGANKVNAPPQDEDGSVQASQVLPSAPVPDTPVSEPVVDSSPVPTKPVVDKTPAPAPVAPAAPTPAPKPQPAPVQANTGLPKGDGVTMVSDVGVVQAIGALADVIKRSMSQSELGSRSRVKTD